MDTMYYDPYNPNGINKPAWQPSDVRPIFDGIPYDETRTRTRVSLYNQRRYKVYEHIYACGCRVSDDEGWQPCARPFHSLLASEAPDSAQTVEFFRLRQKFSFILSEAWRRRGPTGSDYIKQIRSEYGVGIERYQLLHDLANTPIWCTDGTLRAQLDLFPGTYIDLYNAGSRSRPQITLHYSYDRDGLVEYPRPIDLGEMDESAIFRLVFP